MPKPKRHGIAPGSSRGHVTRPTGIQLPTVSWVRALDMGDEAHIVEWVPTGRQILVNADHRYVSEACEFWKDKVAGEESAAALLDSESRDLWNIQLIGQVLLLERLLDGKELDQEAYSVSLGTVFLQRVVTDSVLKQAIPKELRSRTW